MRSHNSHWPALLAGGALIAVAAGWAFIPRAQAAADPGSRAALTQGFATGALGYQAIGPLTFSPSGVLYFADDQAGAVYGVDLKEKASKAEPYAKVADLGATLGARLGTTAAGV